MGVIRWADTGADTPQSGKAAQCHNAALPALAEADRIVVVLTDLKNRDGQL